MMVTTRSTWRHKDTLQTFQLVVSARSLRLAGSLPQLADFVGHFISPPSNRTKSPTAPSTGNVPHLLLSQLSSPFVEVNIGLPQDDVGITSADALRHV